jgi:hypothetical protein
MYKALFVLALASAPAFAQPKDPKFEYGKADEVKEVKEVEWNAQAEAGAVFTTGNSKTTTVAAGFKAARKTGGNKLTLEGSLTYAKSSVRTLAEGADPMNVGREDIITINSVTAETVFGKARYDRFLTKHNSLFGAAIAARDLPAGKEAVFGGQLGYSRRLYKSDTDEAVAELGYDYSRENLVSGDPVSIHSLRGFVGFKSAMAAGTTLDASVEGLTNLNDETLITRAEKVGIGEDTRVNVRAAVSAKIGKSLAIQTSFEARYDNRPAPLVIGGIPLTEMPGGPAFEASTFDTILKVSLIYAFVQPPAKPKPPEPAKK